MKFWFKYVENWWSWKKKIFLLHLNENKQPIQMRYHLFLQYGWFNQNLGKDFIPTNMHTTVHSARTKSQSFLMPLLAFISNCRWTCTTHWAHLISLLLALSTYRIQRLLLRGISKIFAMAIKEIVKCATWFISKDNLYTFVLSIWNSCNLLLTLINS